MSYWREDVARRSAVGRIPDEEACSFPNWFSSCADVLLAVGSSCMSGWHRSILNFCSEH